MFFSKKVSPTEELPRPYTHEEYRANLDDIYTYLKDWVQKDLLTADDANIPNKSSITYILTDINLKLFPMAEVRSVLDKLCTSASEYQNRSYGRWQDTVLRIEVQCHTEVLSALKSKFLKTVCSGLGSIQGLIVEESDWLEAIKDYPWLYLIPFLQSLVETDEQIASFFKSRRL